MKIARELVMYAGVSGVAFSLDLGTLALLVEFGHWNYLPASAIAFVVGGLAAWWLSVRLVFSYRRVRDPRLESLTFVALGLVGMAANLGLLTLGVEWLGLHYAIAKIGAGGCTVGLNFAMRRLLLFTRLGQPGSTETDRNTK